MLKSASLKPNYGARNRCVALAVMIGLWCLHCLFHFSSTTTRPNYDHTHQQEYKLQSSSSNSLTFSTASANKHDLISRGSRRQQLAAQANPAASFMPHNDDHGDDCHGKYVYIHKLPPAFNQDLLTRCEDLSPWTDMCKVLSNDGLGPKLDQYDDHHKAEHDIDQGPHINAPVVSENGWFATNQFALDVIFHNRMKQYRCLTEDSSKATLVYVPFYAGLDVSRNLWGANVSARDALPRALARWLQDQPEWAASGGGRNHFMVCGRMTWDFRRLTQEEADWGNTLLLLPAVRNMSTLLIEKSPWHSNDYAIPYPTYFHPSSDADIAAWQDRMRSLPRPSLFSFAGAPREEREDSIRGEIIQQCKQSPSCTLLECDRGASKCHSPLSVMRLFEGSVFCLQPQGDSYTRRSLFDSMVAGCIPVLFNPHSAYSQYVWHLPRSHNSYSVFILDEDVKKRKVVIEDVLRSIPPQQVKRLREQVISLIPRLIYADPRFQLQEMKDAFDVTVEALIEKVANSRFHPINEEEGEGAAII